jgi:hypothetical protein
MENLWRYCKMLKPERYEKLTIPAFWIKNRDVIAGPFNQAIVKSVTQFTSGADVTMTIKTKSSHAGDFEVLEFPSWYALEIYRRVTDENSSV